MPKELATFIPIPVYSLWMELVVTTSSSYSQKKRKKRYDLSDTGDAPGCLVYDGQNFGIILVRNQISYDLIAHEVFHAVHRMMEFIGHGLHKDYDEPHAYLCGYLTMMIHRQLKEWKVKVKLT